MTELTFPWTPVTDIKAGWFVHRWGDWLLVKDAAADDDGVTLLVVDHNPQDGIGLPVEKCWSYSLSDQILATPTPLDWEVGLTADEFKTLSLTDRVRRYNALIANGRMEVYAKVIGVQYPHPNGMAGFLADEVRHYDPVGAANRDAWFK